MKISRCHTVIYPKKKSGKRNFPFSTFHFQLTKLSACGDGIVHHQQVQLLLAVLGVDGGDQHAVRLPAHHLCGGQVDDGDQGLADQLLGLVELGDAGEDLAFGAGAVVQGELQQLVGLLDILAVDSGLRPSLRCGRLCCFPDGPAWADLPGAGAEAKSASSIPAGSEAAA